MKFNKRLLIKLVQSEFRISVSSLFHFLMIDGKKLLGKHEA